MTLPRILVRVGIAALLAAVITGALIASGVIAPRQPRTPPLPDHGPVMEWTLTERSGAPLSGKDLLGKVWIADFFFTSCKGPCPTMTANMALVQSDLADVADVRLVSFTMDPVNDTPETLARYADLHGASKERWLFATGAQETIHELSRKGFKIGAGLEGGEIIHGTYFALVDQGGRLRGFYNVYDGGAEERARLTRDARRLVSERVKP